MRLIDADRLDALVKITLQKILEKLPNEETDADNLVKAVTIAAWNTFSDMIANTPTAKGSKE